MSEEAITSYCNRCQRETAHLIRAEFTRHESIDFGVDAPPVEVFSAFQIIQCRGCDVVDIAMLDTVGTATAITDMILPVGELLSPTVDPSTAAA